MRFKLGWYFPISELENVIFKHQFSNLQNWQIKVNKYQVINGLAYPKIIRLQHTQQAIKIKLLLRDINRLK